MKNLSLFVAAVLCIGFVSPTLGQSTGDSDVVVEKAQDAGKEKVKEKIDDLAQTVNENETAQQARESILKPIYEAAQYVSGGTFYWVAFALMVAGLVSFALQLVLGKLFMLAQFHFSLMEIMADGLGFLISAIGLILTTLAATDNSSFTENTFLVLSAAGVGLLFGLIFYVRGQTQEFREMREVRRRKK